jgi:cytochrome oxidase Cu insertion factor (SCO1/SenC/PrrC family)
MMTLQDQLNQLKASFEEKAPPEALEVTIGDRAPEFELENARGKPIRSKDILSDRLMVLTFYRGQW